MPSVSISIECSDKLDFSAYHLFLVESALALDMGNLYIGKAENRIDLKISGMDDGIKSLHKTLLETAGKYGIEKINDPAEYSGHIPTIDKYMGFAILREQLMRNAI